MKNKATEFSNTNQANIDGFTINDSWNLFKIFIKNLINYFVPSKKSSTKPKVPWITANMKRQINRKNRFYKNAVQSKKPDMWKKYRLQKS